MGGIHTKEILDKIYNLNCEIQELKLKIMELQREVERKDKIIEALQLFNDKTFIYNLYD